MKEHPIVTGVILMTLGVLGLYGSVTGNLAAMLTTLFDPSNPNLITGSTGSSSTSNTGSNAPLVDSGNVTDVGSTASPSGNASTTTPGLKGGFTPVPVGQT